MKIFVLNGPELDRLGEREPEIYGTTTLAELEKMCRERAQSLELEIDFRQTNDENELIGWLEKARNEADGVVINPAAFTHYSEAVRGALAATGLPVIEVHISNIYAREEWRAKSLVSPVVKGVIVGLGVRGYLLALDALAATHRKE